jgi:pyruvate kinase
VANAVLDGSDALMLSEETAVGAHPVAAVQMMSLIIDDVESVFPHHTWSVRFGDRPKSTTDEAVAHSACRMAEEIDAAAIVSFTQSGSTARLLAHHRPRQQILAMTPEELTFRSLALAWGTVPIMTIPAGNSEEMEKEALRVAKELGYVETGDTVVITAGVPVHVRGNTNLIRVARVE